jgi:hypothetical protein
MLSQGQECSGVRTLVMWEIVPSSESIQSIGRRSLKHMPKLDDDCCEDCGRGEEWGDW